MSSACAKETAAEAPLVARVWCCVNVAPFHLTTIDPTSVVPASVNELAKMTKSPIAVTSVAPEVAISIAREKSIPEGVLSSTGTIFDAVSKEALSLYTANAMYILPLTSKRTALRTSPVIGMVV